jgi:fused signal recognition particle receptor
MFWRRNKNKGSPDPAPDSEGEPEPADASGAGGEPAPAAEAEVAPTAPLEPAPEPDSTPAAAVDAALVEAPEPEAAADSGGGPRKRGWLRRLTSGLSRSSSKVGGGIGAIFTKRKLDDEALEELEELLISADLGVSTSARLAEQLGKRRFAKEVDPESVRAALAEDIAEILTPVAQPLELDRGRTPHVILVVGVNGSGKTTTIGKLAKQWTDAGRKVHLAAGDTFRAAAVEQLQIWGQRTGVPVTAKETGADAAGLAYDALQAAKAERADALLIDTAGRLHNKSNLMAELQKIVRVIQKLDPSAPHATLLVLDATTGQNAVQQVQTFRELVNVSGLVVTKLDGSARGGVLVALAERFGLPVHAVGVGESAEDLRPFSARAFARALVGLDPEG